MTYKERILAAIRGTPSDELPVCPRIELWHNANKLRGTLPDKYKHATIYDIVEDLDIGFNTTIPNFRELDDPTEEAFRALGLYQCRDICYRVDFDLDVKKYIDADGKLVTEYATPHGAIRTKTLYNEAMRRDGITISHIAEKAFKSADDYAALAYIFRHAVVKPRLEGMQKMADEAGSRGVPIGWISSSGSPMHYIMKQLMPFDLFFYEMFDHPEELADLADAIGSMESKILDVMMEMPFEVYRSGGNYDSMMQNPPFFEEHIVPALKRFADRIHAKGAYFLSHTDGENAGLLEHYLSADIDIADSLCPAPMTKVPMKESRRVFGKRITTWGGIPSLMMLPDSYSEYEYDRYLDEFFQSIGDGSRLIISIADTTPPDADFNRIVKLIKRAKAFGPVPGVDRPNR